MRTYTLSSSVVNLHSPVAVFLPTSVNFHLIRSRMNAGGSAEITETMKTERGEGRVERGERREERGEWREEGGTQRFLGFFLIILCTFVPLRQCFSIY